MMRSARVAAQLAVEALRAGVPNREAIHRLGSPNTSIEADFIGSLRDPFDYPQPGMMLAGGFGTGKSHLLGYLGEIARRRNFVVSVVVISKETPLSIPGITLAAAVRNARTQNINDDAITSALSNIQRIQGAVQALELWTSDPAQGMSPVFAAILYLLNRTMEAALRHSIEAFLAGAKPPLPALRTALKQAGAKSMFDLGTVKPADLARQRMRFLPQLFRAAGFAGWVVLLDEAELIGRYGPLQRALAYAELSQWLGLYPNLNIPGLVAVSAISDDFYDQVINAKQDDEKLILQLQSRNLPLQADLARLAMAAIKQARKLRPPDDSALRQHEEKIRACYTEAYGWEAPQADIAARTANRTMRHHIRGWITQWDMLRIQGVHTTPIEKASTSDYSEDQRLTELPEGSDDPG